MLLGSPSCDTTRVRRIEEEQYGWNGGPKGRELPAQKENWSKQGSWRTLPHTLRVEVPTITEEEIEYKPTGHTTGGNYNSFASRRNRRHSFMARIIEIYLPHKWKAPTITYNGTTNLDEFISIYTNQVGLYSPNDVVLCKSFSIRLRGSALELFMSLPPYTIDSFNTLTTSFTTQFHSNCCQDLT